MEQRGRWADWSGEEKARLGGVEILSRAVGGCADLCRETVRGKRGDAGSDSIVEVTNPAQPETGPGFLRRAGGRLQPRGDWMTAQAGERGWRFWGRRAERG